MVEVLNTCAITVTPSDSLLVLLIGMLTIFLALTVIIFVVKGYVGVFKLMDLSKKRKSEKQTKKVAVPEVEVEEVATPVASNDDELIAVITAAISAVYAQTSEDGEVPPFRVKSIFLK